jgi:hypothetical protein
MQLCFCAANWKTNEAAHFKGGKKAVKNGTI